MAGVILSKMSGVVASSLGAGRAAPCRLLVPQHGQGLFDPPLARLGLLRALDRAHVLPLAAGGQAVVGGAGDRNRLDRSMSWTPSRIELTCAFMPYLLWCLVVMHMAVTLRAAR
jgi:hypothetical protein